MQNFVKEFKEFAIKGNVLDLAIGVIIGGAFGKIVSSLVTDVIMPLIGVLVGTVDFKELKMVVGKSTVTYGNFIQNIFDFLIVAFVIFLTIKTLNSFKRKQKAAEATTPVFPISSKEVVLLTEIRDILAKKN